MNASSFEFLIYGRMIVRIFCILLLLPILLVAEEAPADYSMAATDSTYADSLSEEKEFTDYLKHPLTYIVQPVLDILVYPLAAPIRYASKHDVIEKSAEALAFGENKNIFLSVRKHAVIKHSVAVFYGICLLEFIVIICISPMEKQRGHF